MSDAKTTDAPVAKMLPDGTNPEGVDPEPALNWTKVVPETLHHHHVPYADRL
jgi:hypothetical protein